MAICVIKGCGKKMVAHGWCSSHYNRWHWRSLGRGRYLPLTDQDYADLADACPEERSRILQGKVWRQTKDGYEEVSFAPPEPSKYFP